LNHLSGLEKNISLSQVVLSRFVKPDIDLFYRNKNLVADFISNSFDERERIHRKRDTETEDQQ